jgi:hypothetical protein
MSCQAKAIVNGSTFENIDRLAVSFDRDGFRWPVPHFEATLSEAATLPADDEGMKIWG